MKSLCYIIALCLVIFTSLPCPEFPSEERLPGTCEEQDSCPDETDGCSSFCPCACIGCYALNLNIPFSYSMKAVEYAIFTPTTYFFSFYQSYLSPVWQPPQVV